MKPSRVQRVGTRLRDCSEIAEANLFRYGRSEKRTFSKGTREKTRSFRKKKRVRPTLTRPVNCLISAAVRRGVSARLMCASLSAPQSPGLPSPRSHPALGATLGPRLVPSVFVCDTLVRPSSFYRRLTTAAIYHLTRRAPICLHSRAGNVYAQVRTMFSHVHLAAGFEAIFFSTTRRHAFFADERRRDRFPERSFSLLFFFEI